MQICDHVDAGKIVLTLTGRMDFEARHTFPQAIENAKRANPKQIILNVSHVPFIDSAGLGLIMLANKNLEEAHICLSIEVPEGYVREILTLTSMSKVMPITLIDGADEIIPKPTPSLSVAPVVKVPPKPPLVFESPDMSTLLRPILEKLEKNEVDLPPLSEVARRVLALTNDPEAHVSYLTEIIQADPILTAKIFKVSNSAACGTRKEISSLPQAIAWLGLNSVAGIALALSVQTGVFNDRGYEREVRNIWAHAITTAFYAKALAGMIGKNPDTAFLCGLLHSIGKLFVVHTINQSPPSVPPPLSWATMLTLIEHSYIDVGRQIADVWNLPNPVKEAIKLHQHHSYHLATDPSKGAALTCLAKHVATYHLDAVIISEDMLRVLPVTTTLQIPSKALTDLEKIMPTIQSQMDILLR